jgi:hypothetical protein
MLQQKTALQRCSGEKRKPLNAWPEFTVAGPAPNGEGGGRVRRTVFHAFAGRARGEIEEELLDVAGWAFIL